MKKKAIAPTIRTVMSEAPHTIGSDQKLSAAHKMMRDHRLRHLPVMRGGQLVGVLSQRDLYFLESMAGVDIDLDVVADAMTPDVYTTAPEAPIHDVVETMAKQRFGCAVVVDHGHVAGIFTVTDALRHLAHILA